MDAHVECRTFEIGDDAVGLPELLDAHDPSMQQDLYRQAGLRLLAENVQASNQFEVARRNYEELLPGEYDRYRAYLTKVSRPEDHATPPPAMAVAALARARQSAIFTDFQVLSHPKTGEALLIGTLRSPLGTIRCKISHWGEHLTSLEELNKGRHRFKMWVKKARRLIGWRPQSEGGSGILYFGILTMIALGTCWALLPVTGWWLFMVLTAVASVFCVAYVDSRTDEGDPARYVVGSLVVISVVLGLITGIVRLIGSETRAHVDDVLVCKVYDDSSIRTSEGQMYLDPGFYDGTYYPANSLQAGKSLQGKWVRVTWHGLGRQYVTKADVLRDGNCG